MKPEDQSDLMKEIILDFKREHGIKESRQILYSITLNYFKHNNWSFTEDCLGLDDVFDEVFKERLIGYYE